MDLSQQALDIWGLLGTLIGTLLLLALTFWAGKHVTRQARELWHTVRGHKAALIHAIDEPTDPAVVTLAQVSPVPAAVWAAFLPAFVNALAAGLDQALAEKD
jgi:hypothetical protein